MPPRMRRRITTARREEIEKEQEELLKTIVRPFDVLNGLPVSFSKPPVYEDVLENVLTVKDSGVFYRSLMKSRFNYLHVCPMFKLHWVKQSSYAKKLMEMDRPLPKSHRDDFYSNREPVLGPEVSARDVMVKLSDATMTFGPHFFEVRLFIAKDGRSTKTKEEKKEEKIKKKEIKMREFEEARAREERMRIENNINKDGRGVANINAARSVSTVVSVDNEKTTVANTPSTKPATKPGSPDLGSIDNSIMISNLNTIASTDKFLNDLMKTVALGKSSPQQIATFQQYIKRAREMGPQPHHVQLYLNAGLEPPAHLKYKKPKEEPPAEKVPVKKGPKKIPQGKLAANMKLTAFQERYLQNATLLIEYAENQNARFQIPKWAICEVIPREENKFSEEEQKERLERLEKPDDEEQEGYDDPRDVVISFLWIHNQREVDEYEEKKRLYDEQQRKEKEEKEKEEKEKEEKEKKEKEKKENDENDDVEVRVTRRGTSKNKKSVAKKPKKLEEPVEPSIRYTPMSFTLHQVPTRFITILVNSFKPVEEVRQRMEHILANHQRMSNFYLWYQLDGKLDEGLAEEIRMELNVEEKKMVGVQIYQDKVDKKRSKAEKAERKRMKLERKEEERRREEEKRRMEEQTEQKKD